MMKIFVLMQLFSPQAAKGKRIPYQTVFKGHFFQVMRVMATFKADT
jgi:hypothetical protein